MNKASWAIGITNTLGVISFGACFVLTANWLFIIPLVYCTMIAAAHFDKILNTKKE